MARDRTRCSGRRSMAKPRRSALLLENGADIEARDRGGNTALIWAGRDGYIDTVKVLLDKGANIKARDNSGNTALTWEAVQANTEMAKLLQQNGATVGATDRFGRTALVQAAGKGDIASPIRR